MTWWSLKCEYESRGDDMPKESFFNLPEEKRHSIEEAIITEFENYNYDIASTNRIIANCSISKGSLYQYFEDKKDIYKYLIEKIVKEKMKYISPVMMNPDEHDFFTVVREMYGSGLSFANEHPRFVRIGNRLLNDRTHPLYKEIVEENKSTVNNVFENLLIKAIERGEVRSNLDTKMISHIISTLSVFIGEYYTNNVNDQWNEKLMETLDKFLDFLEFGIGRYNTRGVMNND